MDQVDPALLAEADTVESLRALVDRLQSQVTGLTLALDTSRQIGAAIGIIMALNKVSRDDAFDVLRRASQRQNRKLRELADEVVEFGAMLF